MNLLNYRFQNLSMKQFFFVFFIITFLCSSVVVNAESTIDLKPNETIRPKIDKTIASDAKAVSETPMFRAFSVEPRGRYIVGLVDASVARYRGGIQGYEATSTEGKSKLDIKSTQVQAYANYLETTQEKLIQAMQMKLGRSIKPLDQFQYSSNAFVVELTKAEAELIAQLGGVRSVVKDQLFKLEKTEVFNGYALPGKTNPSAADFMTGYLVIGLFLLLLAAFFAYKKGWLGRRSALFVFIMSTLGIAGCYYEGGFEWIGAPQIWAGSAGLEPTQGEGVVVGIIDSGINPISDSFSGVSGDGYQHTNPKGKFFGVCDMSSEVYDASFPCNEKLIGAWGVTYINDGSPRDMGGHGSHTAGTSAGNVVYNATVTAPTGFEVTKTIAGVAPRSNIIAYTVCAEDGCYLTAILFAVNQAILDGVDVLNYSIGGGSSDPWADYDSLSFLSAMDAGIFVATSSGNSGPDFATLGSPADAPWITSVAASSHNLFYQNRLIDLVNDQGVSFPDILGQSITPGLDSALIVDATDYGNSLCLEELFTAPFDGEIVLCDAGENARVEKGENVLANGGAGLILARPPSTPDGSGYYEADAHVVPAVHIMYSDAEKLRAWLDSGTGHRGSLAGTTLVVDDEYADVLAYFSSRGVNPSVRSVVKPNITAPGRAIFAAFHEDYSEAEQDYNIIQGTSMSSPHIAGAGALLTALHPDWTPMQIQSAMMTTANLNHVKEDGVTQADPFDVGAGRIDLPAAARAALLLDEQLDGFLAADPYIGGDPAQLNLTSMGQVSCVVSCSWTRTVTNVSDQYTRWRSLPTESVTVEPRRFSLAPGESLELTFTADAGQVEVGEWLFDQVSIMSRSRHIPDVHFPMAALSSLSNLPDTIEITAVLESDVVTLSDLKAVEINSSIVDITGLAKADVYEGAVVSDPTNGNPFDGGYDSNVDGQALFLVEVPEGSTRFVAEITQSISEDLDVYVGTGEEPSVDTLIASGATGGALEYVNVNDPAAGMLWIVVQNWEGTHVEPSAFTLSLAVVGGDDEGNMSVDVPVSQAAGVDFEASIGFVLPGSVAGDRYYGSFSLGTDASSPANLGTVKVDLVRQ